VLPFEEVLLPFEEVLLRFERLLPPFEGHRRFVWLLQFWALCAGVRPERLCHAFHRPCGNVPPNPADKKRFVRAALGTCGKRRKSPSLFRRETRSFITKGTAILSKPLQRDAEFFRTHLLLPLLTKKTFVLKEETWS
jgi:hypothetical protein